MRRLGILGGGQLGMMLGAAAGDLGVETVFFDTSSDVPARRAGPVTAGDFADTDALHAFARACDVITYEWENVPVQAVEDLAAMVGVHPAPRALAVAQDRLDEKTFLASIGIPTVPHAPVDGPADGGRALAITGTPAILKTRRLGYDGRGQVPVSTADDLPAACTTLGAVPLILEQRVALTRELAVIGARDRGGTIVIFPIVENHHRAGILRLSSAPAEGVSPELHEALHAHMRAALAALDYVGVLTIEFFICDGVLFANEMAPRVHNSGHWTIEGTTVSQFSNHVRAVMGMPVEEPAIRGVARMLNVIGVEPDVAALPDDPRVHVHLYGKSPRADRKLGHITIVADTPAAADELVDRVRRAYPHSQLDAVGTL